MKKRTNFMGQEEAQSVKTGRDYAMVIEGLRPPKIDKLPCEIWQKTKEQRQEIRKLAKQQPLENRVMAKF